MSKRDFTSFVYNMREGRISYPILHKAPGFHSWILVYQYYISQHSKFVALSGLPRSCLDSLVLSETCYFFFFSFKSTQPFFFYFNNNTCTLIYKNAQTTNNNDKCKQYDMFCLTHKIIMQYVMSNNVINLKQFFDLHFLWFPITHALYCQVVWIWTNDWNMLKSFYTP